MEPVLAECNAFDFATDDFISNMPENIIAEILERMPIQDAVRTGVFSKGWRLHWTKLTKLVFDQNFYQFIIKKSNNLCSWQTVINRVLLLLKYPVTKFVLYIPESDELDVASINYWILFLSTKGSLKDFVLVNMHKTQLKLPACFFSCFDELQHLVLHNINLKPTPACNGFPNLITVECSHVYFDCFDSKYQIHAGRPLLEKLVLTNCRLGHNSLPFRYNPKLKVFSFTRAMGTRRTLCLARLTCFRNLEEIYLDFNISRMMDETAALRKITTVFYCLKALQLYGIGFNDSVEVFFTFWLIHKSPNLQKLEIATAEKQDRVLPSAACPWEDGCRMGRLHTVKLYNIEGLKDELNLIKFLLASSPLLKKMEVVQQRTSTDIGHLQSVGILEELMKFPRASPKAEIDVR